jgi:hypothetical protein
MAGRLEKVAAWIEKEDMLEWVKPQGGVVRFTHIKESLVVPFLYVVSKSQSEDFLEA